MKLLFATQNRHKVDEVKQIIGSNYELMTLNDLNFKEELPETHFTFRENALEKATQAYNLFHLDCFAEDTGLEVEALNGEPGVLSARYAGVARKPIENMKKVLRGMKYKDNHKARFCTIVSLIIGGKNFFFEGVVNGIILKEPTGTGGFGYDPIFKQDGFSKSFAEMTKEEKNSLSHRAIAFGKMKIFLETELVK